MSSSNVEAALRRYYTSYDGTPKQFVEVEALFDSVYHENFTLFLKDNGDSYVDPVRGNLVGRETILDRDAVKKFHASYLTKGARVVLIHYRRIGLDCVDVQFQVESKSKGDTRKFRMVYTIEDNKIVKFQEVNDNFFSVLKAKCSSGLHTFNVYQTSSY